MGGTYWYTAVFVGSVAATAALTPLFAAFARRAGLMVAPRPDRWHQRPTPLGGGAAMGLVVLAVLAATLPLSRPSAAIMVCAAGALALGLIDDFRKVAPATKLVGQVLIASALVFGGVQVEVVPFAPIAFLLTVFWVVGLMNAVNLIDNMDGLAGGITAIAALALAATSISATPVAGLLAIVTAGTALGFVAHNFPPAKVFMGDGGSQLLGFLLAAAALLHTATSAANLSLAVLSPIVVLALPIFDTALVAVSRGIAGVPLSHGGRDHTSHRLAALGLSDRSTVIVLYAVSTTLALLGLLAQALAEALVPLLALVVVSLVLFGVFLHEVDAYGREGMHQSRPTSPRDRVLRSVWSYGRFGAEVGLDAILLTVAYYSSYLIRFEGFNSAVWTGLFAQSVSLVVGIQLATLVVLGVYRTLWRYLHISDFVQIGKAILFGTSAAALAIYLGFRLENYSRAVLILDGILATTLLIASRSFFLWLRHVFESHPREDARRVLIFGATDRGVSAMRLLTRSTDVRYRPVAFVDDDKGKHHRRIAGVPVVGAVEDLPAALPRYKVDLVVVAEPTPHISRIRDACSRSGIECREFLVPV